MELWNWLLLTNIFRRIYAPSSVKYICIFLKREISMADKCGSNSSCWNATTDKMKDEGLHDGGREARGGEDRQEVPNLKTFSLYYLYHGKSAPLSWSDFINEERDGWRLITSGLVGRFFFISPLGLAFSGFNFEIVHQITPRCWPSERNISSFCVRNENTRAPATDTKK